MCTVIGNPLLPVSRLSIHALRAFLLPRFIRFGYCRAFRFDENPMSIDLQSCRLGEGSEPLTLESSADHCAAAVVLATQATRSVHIFSQQLDRRVYDQKPFIDALTQLALRSPQCKVLILVRDTNDMIHNGHRLIEAMRRLPSRMQLRKVHEDFLNTTEEFIVADETGLLLRRIATRYEGSVSFNARKEARERVKFFNEVWRPSEPDPKLKHLSI